MFLNNLFLILPYLFVFFRGLSKLIFKSLLKLCWSLFYGRNHLDSHNFKKSRLVEILLSSFCISLLNSITTKSKLY